MRLSAIEKQLVRQLEKRQQSLRRWRWAWLAGAVVYLVAAGYILAMLTRMTHHPDLATILLVALLIPTFYVLALGGAGLLIYLLTHWNGRPETRLLLRVIKESQDEEN